MNKKGKRLSNEKQKNKHKNNKKLIIVIIILSHKQIWIV